MNSLEVQVIGIPTVMSIAFLVIAGEFGNGDDRKKNLAAAGYDYNRVQACVNDLVPLINKYGG